MRRGAGAGPEFWSGSSDGDGEERAALAGEATAISSESMVSELPARLVIR